MLYWVHLVMSGIRWPLTSHLMMMSDLYSTNRLS
jgi:hypothetical protein